MIENLILLMLAALPLMASPGPATLSLAGMGVAYGVSRSVPYLLGVVTGTVSVLVLIASGITGLILANPALVTVISLIAIAYMLYLAYRIATAPLQDRQTRHTKAPTIVGGYIFAIANPKAYAAFAAVFSSYTLVAGSILHDAAAKILALAVGILIVHAAWLAFGAFLSRFLSDPKTGRIANVCFAVMLLASVAYAFWELARQ